MVSIFVADIHQTPDPREAYRWGLFKWLAQQAEKYHADYVFVLGDGTNNKDRHPASLVNAMVEGVERVAKKATVIWLMGNHDYIDPANPFFGFIGKIPNVLFVTDPTEMKLQIARDNVPVLLLPSATNPVEEWAPLRGKMKHLRYIFCHQTFAGALRDNGTASPDGVPADWFKGATKAEVLSGDIHVPQKLGKDGPEYIGAPYRIDFGDRYSPRALLIRQDGSHHNLRFPCPTKHLLEISEDGEVRGAESIERGDLVKVRVQLARASFPLWPKLREQVKEMAAEGGWLLYGPELREFRVSDGPNAPAQPLKGHVALHPKAIVEEFSAAEGFSDDLRELGVFLIEQA